MEKNRPARAKPLFALFYAGSSPCVNECAESLQAAAPGGIHREKNIPPLERIPPFPAIMESVKSIRYKYKYIKITTEEKRK